MNLISKTIFLYLKNSYFLNNIVKNKSNTWHYGLGFLY